VKPTVESVDSSLGRSTESVRTRLLQDLESLEKKAIRSQKRNQQQIREQLDKAANHLVPLHSPQERLLSPLHFLNRLGPAFIGHLLNTVSLDTSEHQVMEV
jgi:bacillithiol synthase